MVAVRFFARLVDETKAPAALPRPNRIAFGPRVKVRASELKRSFGMLLVKKSWPTTVEAPPRLTNLVGMLMKSFPFPVMSEVDMMNGSVFGANAMRS